MSNLAETISAGQAKLYNVQGDFIRLMNSTGLVELVFFKNGAEIARTGNVLAGYAEDFDKPFDQFTITDKSGAANAFELIYRNGSRARYDRGAATVNIANPTQVRKQFSGGFATVPAANTKLLNAKADRDYLMVQNLGTTDINIRFDGITTVDPNENFRLVPNGVLELCNTVPTSEVWVRSVAGGSNRVCWAEA